MEKHNLRKVVINEGQAFKEYGYFHCWGEFSDEDGSGMFAIVELADGRCNYYNCDQIRFLDREAE